MDDHAIISRQHDETALALKDWMMKTMRKNIRNKMLPALYLSFHFL